MEILRHGARRERHRSREDGEDQHPEQHRAFVIAPDAGDFIDQRLRRSRILINVDEREIGGDVRVSQRDIGQGDKTKSGKRDRRRDAHQAGIACRDSPERYDRIETGERQRQDQCEMAGFDDH